MVVVSVIIAVIMIMVSMRMRSVMMMVAILDFVRHLGGVVVKITLARDRGPDLPDRPIRLVDGREQAAPLEP